jgi:hypothetical protein
MHPIEWLRAVARSDHVPHAELASEAAAALSALAHDSGDLLLSCRRLLDRHPQAGSLWWACARMVAARDPAAESRDIRRDVQSDQVGLNLAVDIPDETTVAIVGAPELVTELAARRGDLRILTLDDTGHSQPAGNDAVVAVPPVHIGAMVAASDLVVLSAWATSGDSVIAPPGSLAGAVLAQNTHRGLPAQASPDNDPAVWLTVGIGRRLPQPLFEAMRRRLFPAGVDPWLACAEMLDVALVDRVIEPVRVGCPAPPELLGPAASA